jgi:hypothetical protein
LYTSMREFWNGRGGTQRGSNKKSCEEHEDRQRIYAGSLGQEGLERGRQAGAVWEPEKGAPKGGAETKRSHTVVSVYASGLWV